MSFKQPAQHFDFARRSFVFQAQENDASMRAPLAENLFAKVFVVGYKNPVFGEGLVHQVVVARSARLIEDGKYLVSFFLKPSCHGGTGTFVHQKAHGLLGAWEQRQKSAAFQGAAREEQAGADVFGSEAVVLV